MFVELETVTVLLQCYFIFYRTRLGKWIFTGLWPVVDLYGQCAQVTIVHNPIRHDQSLISVSQYLDMSHLSLPAAGQASVGSEVCFRACGRFLRYGSQSFCWLLHFHIILVIFLFLMLDWDVSLGMLLKILQYVVFYQHFLYLL